MKDILFSKCAEAEFFMKLFKGEKIGERYTIKWAALFDVVNECGLREAYNEFYAKYEEKQKAELDN